MSTCVQLLHIPHTFVYMGKSVIAISCLPHLIFFSFSFSFLSLFYFERKNFSQHLEISNLAILESSRDLNVSNSPVLEWRHVLPCLLLHECRDVNSGRNSCVGGTLIMELVPWPTGLVYVVFFLLFLFCWFFCFFLCFSF